MAKKFDQGIYEVINRQKYIGNKNPIFRSSWERRFCTWLDTNQYILQWASEPLRIPYTHPLTGKGTVYVPDFLIHYTDKNSALKVELVEIKPYNQSVITEQMKDRERAIVAVNVCKWNAATAFCKHHGINFRVITERDLFHQGSR